MKAGLLQFCPVRFDVEANLRFIEKSIHAADASLIILPEMCLSGYLFPSREALEAMAEEIPGPSTDRLARICRKENVTLVCGMPEKRGGKLYNSAAVVGPGGLIGSYRKSHLFLDEKGLYEPGDSGFQVFDIDGVKVGVLICFDWVFPESARSLALMGADIIAHCTNLVLPYAQAAAVTRCIENRVFWLLANRTGEEKEGNTHFAFTGRSTIVAPGGDVLTLCDEKTPSLAVVDIDPAVARNKLITAKNDVLADRRTELYK